MRAYMGAGAKIFEKDDPKYLLFLQSKAKNNKSAQKAMEVLEVISDDLLVRNRQGASESQREPT